MQNQLKFLVIGAVTLTSCKLGSSNLKNGSGSADSESLINCSVEPIDASQFELSKTRYFFGCEGADKKYQIEWAETTPHIKEYTLAGKSSSNIEGKNDNWTIVLKSKFNAENMKDLSSSIRDPAKSSEGHTLTRLDFIDPASVKLIGVEKKGAVQLTMANSDVVVDYPSANPSFNPYTSTIPSPDLVTCKFINSCAPTSKNVPRVLVECKSVNALPVTGCMGNVPGNEEMGWDVNWKEAPSAYHYSFKLKSNLNDPDCRSVSSAKEAEGKGNCNVTGFTATRVVFADGYGSLPATATQESKPTPTTATAKPAASTDGKQACTCGSEGDAGKPFVCAVKLKANGTIVSKTNEIPANFARTSCSGAGDASGWSHCNERSSIYKEALAKCSTIEKLGK